MPHRGTLPTMQGRLYKPPSPSPSPHVYLPNSQGFQTSQSPVRPTNPTPPPTKQITSPPTHRIPGIPGSAAWSRTTCPPPPARAPPPPKQIPFQLTESQGFQDLPLGAVHPVRPHQPLLQRQEVCRVGTLDSPCGQQQLPIGPAIKELHLLAGPAGRRAWEEARKHV